MKIYVQFRGALPDNRSTCVTARGEGEREGRGAVIYSPFSPVYAVLEEKNYTRRDKLVYLVLRKSVRQLEEHPVEVAEHAV